MANKLFSLRTMGNGELNPYAVPLISFRDKIKILYRAVLYNSEFFFSFALSIKAQMVELVDTLVSGTSVSNDVQVRVLFWAPKNA